MRGCLTSAYGSSHARWANVWAMRIRKVTEYPTAVITDTETRPFIDEELFDYVIISDRPSNLMCCKVMNWNLTPFDSTVFMDADVIVNDDFSLYDPLWDHGVVLPTTAISPFGRDMGFIRPWAYAGVTNSVYSAIMSYDDGKETENFFRRCENIVKLWDEIDKRLKINKKFIGKTPSDDVVMSFASHDNDVNIINDPTIFAFIHCRSELMIPKGKKQMPWAFVIDNHLVWRGRVSRHPIHWQVKDEIGNFIHDT